jgi:hypothetical protein
MACLHTSSVDGAPIFFALRAACPNVSRFDSSQHITGLTVRPISRSRDGVRSWSETRTSRRLRTDAEVSLDSFDGPYAGCRTM